MSIFDDPGLFGRLRAADYDSGANPDPGPAVDFLARLAEGGPVLEDSQSGPAGSRCP